MAKKVIIINNNRGKKINLSQPKAKILSPAYNEETRKLDILKTPSNNTNKTTDNLEQRAKDENWLSFQMASPMETLDYTKEELDNMNTSKNNVLKPQTPINADNNAVLVAEKVNLPNLSTTTTSILKPKYNLPESFNFEPMNGSEVINKNFNDERRSELEKAYNDVNKANEISFNKQIENNNITAQMALKDAQKRTNDSLYKLAQIQANTYGATMNDAISRQEIFNLQSSLNDLKTNTILETQKLNNQIEAEKQKALAENNLNKYNALKEFDLATTTLLLNELERIDTMKYNVAKTDIDYKQELAKMQQQDYQFEATMEEQRKQREDANAWKAVQSQQWQKEYESGIEQFNRNYALKLREIASEEQIAALKNQYSEEYANNQLYAENPVLKSMEENAIKYMTNATSGQIQEEMARKLLTNAERTMLDGYITEEAYKHFLYTTGLSSYLNLK